MASGEEPWVTSSAGHLGRTVSTLTCESEATARTGHLSSSSHNSSSSNITQVTPNSLLDEDAESPKRPPRPGRLFFCGMDVNNELREDVNETVRQIITTVKSFGQEEKDAVKETFWDASSFMRTKVRNALVYSSAAQPSPLRKDGISNDGNLRKNDSDGTNKTETSEPSDESPSRMRNSISFNSEEGVEIRQKDKRFLA